MRPISRNSKVTLLFILIFTSIINIINYAQDKNFSSIKLEVEKLILFKNGLGFVTLNAKLPNDETTIKIGQLPIPTFGTYWISYPKEVKLKSLITSMEEFEKEIPVQSIPQMLKLNAGHKVAVHTSDLDIEGTILPVIHVKDNQLPFDPYFMSPRQTRDPYGQYLPSQNQESRIISIKTDKGIVILDPSSISRVEFKDSDPVTLNKSTQKCPSIRMELEKPARNTDVNVSYLAHGVTWSPSYLIDLSDPKVAKFSAHAVIINEMSDFKNIEIQLVTGFPNIKYSGILNPIAKSQSLAEFLNSLSNSNIQRRNMDIQTQQAVLSNVAGALYETDQRSFAPDYSTASDGEIAEDLFFYPVNDFTLKKDETAWIPLFSAEMPYKHIYTWKIKDLVDQNDYYRANTEQQDGKNTEEIWHSCRLVNNLKMPLTTAATEFISNEKLTGQDICYYTPPNSETTIRINKAMNIVADQAEIEIDRKRDAARFHGYQYDLVKVQGELKIKNKLDKAVKLEITKELSGDVLESSPKSKDVKIAKGLKQVNTKHILTWDIDLTPSNEEKVSYQYQVYIRE